MSKEQSIKLKNKNGPHHDKTHPLPGKEGGYQEDIDKNHPPSEGCAHKKKT